jgi:hypothetical protein
MKVNSLPSWTSALWLAGVGLVAVGLAAPAAARVTVSSVLQDDLQDQEKQQREAERRQHEQERMDRMDQLYDEGRALLDQDQYEEAETRFSELEKMNGPQTDAVLYWKAYAQARSGKRTAALATIADFKKRFPQSHWHKDVEALEIEAQQSGGHQVAPEAQSDDDLKLLALESLMNTDPERAIPAAEKYLSGSAPPKIKSQALFLLAQSGRPESRVALARIAKDSNNPDVQRRAIQFLSAYGGGSDVSKILAEVYTTTSDSSVKRMILQSYMQTGRSDLLLAAAKSEKDEKLRLYAIRQMGYVQNPEQQKELLQIYKSETSLDIRQELVQVFLTYSNAEALLEVAETEKDADLRRSAVRSLTYLPSQATPKVWVGIYGQESDKKVREEILNALFSQGNAAALVAVARVETDPTLKRDAIQKLTQMNNKDATDFLMELLSK